MTPLGWLIMTVSVSSVVGLTVFCLYRVVLAAFVGLAFVYLNRFFNLGSVNPAAVAPTLVSYSIASLVLR